MGSNRTDWKKQTEVQGQEMGNRTTGGGEGGGAGGQEEMYKGG